MSDKPENRRAAPVAEGVALPPLPLERIIERADENEFKDPETGRIGFDRLGFAQSIERDVIAPYAERIRQLERELKAARTVSDKNFDDILALRAELEEARTAGPAVPDVVTRKAYVCSGCDGVYADQAVTQCDCMPAKQEWIEGAITYAAAPKPQEDA